MPSPFRRLFATFFAFAALLLSAHTLPAQIDLQSLGGDPLGGLLGNEPPRVAVEAAFTAATDERPALLFVTANVRPGFHVYSVTQKKGGPEATKIELKGSPAYKLAGRFQASKAPKVHFEKQIWPDLPIEEHTGKITWYAPIELAEGAKPAELKIEGVLDTQACNAESCVPMLLSFVAKRTAKPPVKISAEALKALQAQLAAAGAYRAEGASVAVRGQLSQSVAAPGDTVQLTLTAVPDEGWHVYALEPRDPKIVGKGKPTLIALTDTGPLQADSPTTDATPVEKPAALPGAGVERYHEGPVTWTVNLRVPKDAPLGEVPISGVIGYQVCFDNGCKPPMGATFQTTLTIGERPSNAPAPLEFTAASYGVAAKAAEAAPGLVEAPSSGVTETEAPKSLATMLVFSFLGGLILNLMPCVLPVIGLKIMSFVEQSGHSRGEALKLNLWYSAGLLAVFLVLATLAVAAGMTWGSHFGSNAFTITLSAIVFAMALSLLGVWEIPIPGFAGGAKAYSLTEKEGPAGAFLKGVLTTVLATPCTGPFMGTALGWAVRQPPEVTYGVFATLGLGMASPYLLVGAFPKLIRFLPKPGNWMVTFKQVMGFVLLGTVIWLLTAVELALILPTVALLVGVGVACWWIARTPATEDFGKQLRAWLEGGAVTALAVFVAFAESLGTYPVVGEVPGLRPVMEYRLAKHVAQVGETELPHEEGELAWRLFSPEKLADLERQNQTVMVDFTADWCPTCKWMEKTVLNTEPVIDLVKELNVRPLLADYTRYPPEIKKVLKKLRSNGVPVLAIFPAGNHDQPIVFRGAYTQSALLDALQQAGPSQPAPLQTAMTE